MLIDCLTTRINCESSQESSLATYRIKYRRCIDRLVVIKYYPGLCVYGTQSPCVRLCPDREGDEPLPCRAIVGREEAHTRVVRGQTFTWKQGRFRHCGCRTGDVRDTGTARMQGDDITIVVFIGKSAQSPKPFLFALRNLRRDYQLKGTD